MINKLRTILVDILAAVIKNFILILLSAAWTLLITYIPSLFQRLRQAGLLDTLAYAVTFASLILTAIATVLLVRNYAKKFKNFDFKFRMIRLEVELEFVTREKILYKLRYHIKATDRVDVLKNKIIWTGSNMSCEPEFTYNPRCNRLESIDCNGNEKNGITGGNDPGSLAVAENSGVIVDGDRKMRDNDIEKYYNIRFVPPLYKGDETRFSIQYECRNDDGTMDPHLGYKIKWPTKRLIMRVKTKADMLSNVSYCVYAEDSDELPLENILPSQPREEDSYDIYEWDVKNPHQFFFYRFDWIFKGTN